MNRRKYLGAIGLAAGAGLAGCSGETGSNNSSGDGGSESTDAGGGGSTEASGGGESTGASTSESEDAGTDAGMGTEAGDMQTTAGDGTSMPTTMAEPSPMTTSGGMSTAMSGGGSADVSIDSSEFSQESESGITDTAMVGELTAPSFLSSIELQARFRNDAGDIVGTQSAYFQGLQEGQTWNFYVPSLASDPPAEGEVEVASATAGSPPSAEGVELVESNLNEPADEFSGPAITGRAENASDSTISYLEASVVFLGDDGTALDSNYTNVSDLPSGETWSFEVEQITYSTDPRPDVADYEIALSTSAI